MKPRGTQRAVLRHVAGLALALLAFDCAEDPSALRHGGRVASGGGAETDTDPIEPADELDAAATSSADSAAPRDAGGTVAPDSGSSPAEVCVAIINEHRAKLNAPPLKRWASGESCADGQATSDRAANKPHGAFTTCGELAQNECLGLSSPQGLRQCLNAMWAEGPGGGHYENMRSTRFTTVACGFGQPANGGWAVQNFR